MLVGGAKQPTLDGMLVPDFPWVGILVNECLHSDGHKRDVRIVSVAV